MALTATVTKSTQKEICKSLGLVKPSVILESPEKLNLVYKVLKKTVGFEEFATLVDELYMNEVYEENNNFL